MEYFALVLLLAGIFGTKSATAATTIEPATTQVVTEAYTVLQTDAATTASDSLTTELVTVAATPAETSSEGLDLTFSLNQEFTSDLNDPSSDAYKELETTVTTEVDKISAENFPDTYVGSEVNSFTAGSVVANLALKFKKGATIPSSTGNFTTQLMASSVLDVVEGSIAVAVTNFTSNATTTAAKPTVPATESPATHAATANEGTLGLKFSLSDTFHQDHLDSTSDKFQTLATTVVKEVNKVCLDAYPSSFRRSITNSFANGSIVTDVMLVFKDKDSVPPASNATEDLHDGLMASNLNIIQGSIAPYSTSSSGCLSPPTAMSLAVLSLVLMRVAQIAQ